MGTKRSLVGVIQILLTLTLSCIKQDLQHLSKALNYVTGMPGLVTHVL